MIMDAQRDGPSPEWVLEHGLDLPLSQLYPQLIPCDEQEISSLAMPVRLQHVLARWRGLTWGAYLDSTPRQLLERRNAGLGSLAAFLRIAASTRQDVPAILIGRGPIATPRDMAEQGPEPGQSTKTVPVAGVLRTIVAWGTFERGRSDFVEILNLAQVDETLPIEINEAVQELRSFDWRAWAEPEASPFDPRRPLREFLGRLGEEDLSLLRQRLVTLERPATLEELGDRRHVTRERIRQIESKLAKRLRSLASGDRSALARTVGRVRAGVGLAMQVSHAATVEALADLGVASLDELDTRVLLWLSGPYQVTGEWLVRRPTQRAVEETRAVLRAITSGGPIAVADGEEALRGIGIVPSELRDWVVSVGGYRLHEEQLVRWGGSIADKAEVLLRLSGTPLNRDELATRLGPGTNSRSMANQLYEDPRFKRTGIRHFGLAEWEHDEYTGVADEIAQEIGRQGGEASLDHLVTFVSATYGVSEASVRAYASGPRFERAPNGSVQLRSETAIRSSSRPIEMTRGAFIVKGNWALRIRINDQHLRGSGFPIPESVARAFGLEPLSALENDSPWGRIRLGWPSLSPHIGSIRPALEAMGAAEGDLVFLAASEGAFAFHHVERTSLEQAAGPARLVLEAGGHSSDGDPLPAIARALAIDESSTEATIARRLRARGEDELASLVTQLDDDSPLVLSLGASRFVEFKLSR